jgi:hypothetical protein
MILLPPQKECVWTPLPVDDSTVKETYQTRGGRTMVPKKYQEKADKNRRQDLAGNAHREESFYCFELPIYSRDKPSLGLTPLTVIVDGVSKRLITMKTVDESFLFSASHIM